ncbi:MAG: two-component system histidine kinase PnpS [Desulfococcaceae bacterium]
MKKYKPLFWRLYPSYLLLVIFSLLAVGIYTVVAVEKFFLHQTASDLQARARLLEGNISAMISPLNAEAVDSLCKSAGKRSGTRITVVLPEGRVIGDSEEEPGKMNRHSDRPEIVRALTGETGTFTRYSETLHQNMMYVAVPVRAENRTLCIIRTSISLDSINKKLSGIQHRSIGMGLMVALMAAAICYYISRRISSPIEEMRKGAEAFAAGNLEYRLPTPKSREMVMLATAMNRMAADLNDRIQTVIRQRNELESVLSSMREGVLAMDMDEKVISINHAAAQMFLREPSKATGKSIQEVVRNSDLHRFVRRALDGESPEEQDITFYHEEERTVSINSSPLLDAKGKRIGILIVLHDVTRLRKLETMRRDFAANVSHEIKTPLTAIKGFVETLQSGAMEKADESARFLEIIEKHVSRLTAIIDDLMKLSEIEQKGRLALEKGNLKSVISNAVEMCRPLAEGKNICMEWECPDSLECQINAAFLEQAVMNLADNAIKYSPEQSTVHINAEKTPDGIVIRVKDQGIGIPREHLPRLFERFYRVDKSRSRKAGGTGLGLAIVKHIVLAHGGYVTVDSRPGNGSTFEIHLPYLP